MSVYYTVDVASPDYDSFRAQRPDPAAPLITSDRESPQFYCLLPPHDRIGIQRKAEMT